MKTIKTTVVWSTEYADVPEQVELKFDDAKIKTIKKALEFLKKNKDISSIRISHMAQDYLDDNGDRDTSTDWRADVELLTVFNSGGYPSVGFYSQNKWDSGQQFETGDFAAELLNK